jgi:hypothetical protein
MLHTIEITITRLDTSLLYVHFYFLKFFPIIFRVSMAITLGLTAKDLNDPILYTYSTNFQGMYYFYFIS